MRSSFFALCAATLLLAACSQSVDERFTQMCKDQAANTSIVKSEEGPCKYGDYLSPADKKQLVDLWDKMKMQEEKVKQMERDLSR
jgi:hypothetical protein